MPIFTQWFERKNVAGKMYGQVFFPDQGFGITGYSANGNANTTKRAETLQDFPVRASVSSVQPYYENATLNYGTTAGASDITTSVSAQKRVGGVAVGGYTNLTTTLAIPKGRNALGAVTALTLGFGDTLRLDSYVEATESGKYISGTRQQRTPLLGAIGNSLTATLDGSVNGAMTAEIAWCPSAILGITRTKGLVAFGHSLVPLIENLGESGPSIAADTLLCPFVGIGRGGSTPAAWNSSGNYELAALSAKNMLVLAMINLTNQMAGTASMDGFTGTAVATATGAGWTISLADTLRGPLQRFRALGLKIYLLTENYPGAAAGARGLAVWDGWNSWLVASAMTYYSGLIDGVIDTRPYFASTPYINGVPLPGASDDIHGNPTQIAAGIAAYFQGAGAAAMVADSNSYVEVISEPFYGAATSTGTLLTGWSEWVNGFTGATRYLKLDGFGRVVTQSGLTYTTYALNTAALLQGSNSTKEFVVRAVSAPWVSSSDAQGLHIGLHATNVLTFGNDVLSSVSREGYSFRISNSGTYLVLTAGRQNSNDQGGASVTSLGASSILTSSMSVGDILTVEITRTLNVSNNNVFTVILYKNGVQLGSAGTITDPSTPARYRGGMYLSVGTAGNTVTTPPNGSGWDFVQAANFDATTISGITGPARLYVSQGGSEPVTVIVSQSSPSVGPAVGQTVSVVLAGLSGGTIGSTATTGAAGDGAFAGGNALAVPAALAVGTIGSATFSCGGQTLAIPVEVVAANSPGGGSGGGDDMTVADDTRVLSLSSSTYTLVAQDGDVFEVTALDGVYLYFKSSLPTASESGTYIGRQESSARAYTLSGVNCYARAAGVNCQIVLVGTLATLP
jgi:hypothetical protein